MQITFQFISLTTGIVLSATINMNNSYLLSVNCTTHKLWNDLL